jgi:hypothetical protein
MSETLEPALLRLVRPKRSWACTIGARAAGALLATVEGANWLGKSVLEGGCWSDLEAGGIVASKDKGGKSEKKKPQKSLKEKRAEKKQKKGK